MLITLIWLYGAAVTFITWKDKWGKTPDNSHIIEIVLVSALWFIFVPLDMLDDWRHRGAGSKTED